MAAMIVAALEAMAKAIAGDEKREASSSVK
jgi:hypothetical protein